MTAHPPFESERHRTRAEPSEPQARRDALAGGPLLLTPEEAAKVLRVGRTTVYALMKAGDLHPVHIGRSCRLSRRELERYVERLEAPPARRRRRRTSPDQRELFDIPASAEAG